MKKAKKKHSRKKKKTSADTRSAVARKTKLKKMHPKVQVLAEKLEFFVKEGHRNTSKKKMDIVKKRTGRSEQAIKDAYNYGEGDKSLWFEIEDIVTPINHKQLFKLWATWPVLEKKLNSIPKALSSILKSVQKLNYPDQVRLDEFLKSLFTANEILKEYDDDKQSSEL